MQTFNFRKRFGLIHLFVDEEYTSKEIKSHLKKQLTHFKAAQNNIDKAKNSFLSVLEGVTDFGVTNIVVQKVCISAIINARIGSCVGGTNMHLCLLSV